MTALKKIVLRLLQNIEGKTTWQKFYQRLFSLSIRGLNYGNGGDFKESGEMFVLQYIKNKLSNVSRIIVFDVGANVGNYSKAVSSIFSKNTMIHAFEPSLNTFEILVKNTNGLDSILTRNFGMSDKSEEVTLYKNNDQSGLSSVYKRRLNHFNISMDQTEMIRLRTIDEYCQEHEILRINLLKIDIEGNELRALNGARHMIESENIDFVQFEFGGCNIDSRTYFQDFYYFLYEKYRIYRIVKDGIIEIKQYNEFQEIFITINYLAINKKIHQN